MAVPNRRTFYPPSLLALLRPYGLGRVFAAMFLFGLTGGWVLVSRLNAPLWSAVAFSLTLLLLPTLRKWQLDRARYGAPMTVLSILLVTQGVHTVEHVAQWVQFYLLGWPLKASSGLISPLNAEVVHFSWNAAVLAAVVYLLAVGLRNGWMWLLLLWAAAHTAEHTYMFVRYLNEVQRLADVGLPLAGAQGLPGFLGNGGWLATSGQAVPPLAFLCTIAPGLTTAPRLDVHFWWNIGEVALLVPAAQAAVRARLAQFGETE